MRIGAFSHCLLSKPREVSLRFSQLLRCSVQQTLYA